MYPGRNIMSLMDKPPGQPLRGELLKPSSLHSTSYPKQRQKNAPDNKSYRCPMLIIPQVEIAVPRLHFSSRNCRQA